MNNLLENASSSLVTALENPQAAANLTVGTRVKADNDCYTNEDGTVVGHTTNMFGAPLVKVLLDSRKNRPNVFYAHELKRL